MSGYFETYRGIVLDPTDPMSEHRVQVQVPDVPGAESAWAKPEQSGAALPTVGDLIGVRFENGDESYPIWSTSWAATGAPGDTPAGTAGYAGTYHGSVLDNVDPGGYRRVRVQVPEVPAAESMWAMPEQADAALPAVGDDVWVRFENGDVSHPTWSGGSGTGGDGGGGGSPAAPAPPATLDGSYRGTVVDNADPGGYRRMLVQVPDVSTESMWAMPGTPDPAVGAEVTVHFENGDMTHPTWSAK